MVHVNVLGLFVFDLVYLSTVFVAGHFFYIKLSSILTFLLRWQPSSEKVDQRYMQNMARPEEKAKFGLYAEDNAESTSDKVTMAQLKRRWGFTEI